METDATTSFYRTKKLVTVSGFPQSGTIVLSATCSAGRFAPGRPRALRAAHPYMLDQFEPQLFRPPTDGRLATGEFTYQSFQEKRECLAAYENPKDFDALDSYSCGATRSHPCTKGTSFSTGMNGKAPIDGTAHN